MEYFIDQLFRLFVSRKKLNFWYNHGRPPNAYDLFYAVLKSLKSWSEKKVLPNNLIIDLGKDDYFANLLASLEYSKHKGK